MSTIRDSRPAVPAYTLLGSLLLSLLFVGSSPALAERVSFSSERWTIEGEETRVEAFDGKECLYLHRGRAVLDGVAFTNGSIEFDLQFTGERGFMGGYWRMTDPGNREEFYIRPHQSGNPDANQYTPVFNGSSGWQLYHGPQYGTPIDYPFNEWIHVRIVFSGTKAEVFVGSDEPTLVIDELKHDPVAGSVGVMANFEPGRFANFEYHENDSIVLAGTPPASPEVPENIVAAWDVSDGFLEESLPEGTELTAEWMAKRSWTRLASEATGITNLARLVARSQQSNTTLARVEIDSGEEQTIPFEFGYSDLARVYLNGKLLYAGSNFYQTRDYRYLGTIGLFDQVFLPLRAGRNELVVAVTEAFGGWGIVGRFPESDGITLLE